MYVVMNKLTVASANAGRIEEGFSRSAERMRGVPGCVSFTFLKEDGIEGDPVYISMTQWESEDAFRAWTQSESFRNAHANAGQTGAHGELHLYRTVFA